VHACWAHHKRTPKAPSFLLQWGRTRDAGLMSTANERPKLVDDTVNLRAYPEKSLSLKDALYGWAYARHTMLMVKQSLESAA